MKFVAKMFVILVHCADQTSGSAFHINKEEKGISWTMGISFVYSITRHCRSLVKSSWISTVPGPVYRDFTLVFFPFGNHSS